MIETFRHAFFCPDCLRVTLPSLLAWLGVVIALRRGNR